MFYFPIALAFIICLAATPFVRRTALSRGWVAKPVKDRWHTRTTALMGGIAIFTGIAIPLLFITDFSGVSFFGDDGVPSEPSVIHMLLIGSCALFLLGLADDFIHIKPHSKLLGQILVAAMVTFMGFRLEWFTSLTLDTMVTMLWIVGVTNAYNLLDNMDGLCAGVGGIGAFAMGLIFWQTAPNAAVAALIVGMSLAAFLVYNFSPASIFMGDCGSLVAGFAIAALGLFYCHLPGINGMAKYAVPVMVVIVPILDTSLVTFIRVLSGRRASMGGRDHTSHRLVLMGFSERGAVLSLYVIAVVAAAAAVFVHRSNTLTAPSVIIPIVLSILLMGIYLSQLRIYPEKEFSLLRGKSFTPILLDLTYKRQVLLVLFDFGLIAFCYYLSYRLRFDYIEFNFYFKVFLKSMPAVIICKFTAFFVVGVYRHLLGQMGTDEVWIYIKATVFGTLLSVTVVTFFYRFEDFSPGIFIIDLLLTSIALLGTRGFFRLTGDMVRRKTLKGEAVLIYGAGLGGELLLREVHNNPDLNLKPVGFIDDDPVKVGKRLKGYPILGTFADIKNITSRYPTDILMVSFQPISKVMRSKLERLGRVTGLVVQRFTVQIDSFDPEAGDRDRSAAGDAGTAAEVTEKS